MWRKVLSWEMEQEKPGRLVDLARPINCEFCGDELHRLDAEFNDDGQAFCCYRHLMDYQQLMKGSSLRLTSLSQLTAEDITNKRIESGDYVTPDQTYTTSNTKKVVFTEGKEYVVTGYPTFTVGLYVQSDLGEWTISFRENGLADHFSWRKPTNEEQKQTTLENNPFITDILNIVTTSGSYPMTVEQITDKVLQLYISEGGKMPPKEFQAKMSVAWGDAFHLGFVAMGRRSDKVYITPEGRQYLQG